MPQASITSFFGTNKREKVVNQDAANKLRKVERDDKVTDAHSSRARHGTLKSYSYGAPNQPEFYDEGGNLERHKAFYTYFTGSKSGKLDTASGRRKMKPYDLQFIDLKRQNMEAILMIQNGYKYQILAEDAFRAARILGRSPINGWRNLEDSGEPTDALYDRFASLTFPIERLPFYVEKLVMQGLKVAVAKQLETSALKAQGDNKRGPFRREVTDIYTKGTMVEELTSSSIVSGHLLALQQVGKSRYALVAIQPATGDAIYDSFEDSSVAIELETRLLHIQPSEVLVVGNELGGIAARMIESLNIRVVTLPVPDGHKLEEIAPEDISKDTGLLNCYSALYQYLLEFKLEHALKLNFHSFTLQSYMYLNGDTLQSLEIYENQTTGQPIGSLMWVIDLTKTSFGKRLLRRWVGKPLMDRALLQERVEAMEEIMHAEGPAAELFKSIQSLLPRLPDLERYTFQIYHGRINPRQLYWCLYFFNVVLTSVTQPQIKAAKLQSPLLEQLFSKFEPMEQIISPLLRCINGNYARSSRDSMSGGINLALYFNYHGSADDDENTDTSQTDDFADVANLELQIADCRNEFTKFLRTESEKLGIALREVNALGEEDTFVIGVAKKDASKVPASWRRQGAITSETRFWAPFSIEQTKRLKPLLEKQAVAAQDAYTRFIKRIAKDAFSELRNCVRSIATLDCLFSLAAVSSRPKYVKPDIVDEPCVEIENGRHPMLEQLMLTSVTPNSTEMYSSKNRVMIISGANMGGKSSYIRQVALLTIMAQIGCYIPASRARISIMDGIYTRMGAFDNLLRGESTFMVELKECSAIMSKATPRSLVLLDEIGRGTSTMDGVAIADAVLQYMIEDVKAFTLFITHYPLLCERASDYGGEVQNWSMDCSEEQEEVTFLYTVVPHQASKSYGVNVARLAGLPVSILNAAKKKSAEFEQLMERRKTEASTWRLIKSVLNGSAPVESLLHSAKHAEEIAETQEC